MAVAGPAVAADRGRHLLDGAVRVFLADALFPLTGVITAAVLTRRLGADGYGAFTLAAAIVAWLEVSITAMFARTTVKFVGSAAQWQPVGATVARVYLLIGAAVAVLLALLAGPLAATLGEPSLAPYMRLLALDVPIFCLTHAHQSILTGLGRFRQRALVTAGRWMTRFVLIILLVALGLSVTGAILGIIGASVVELCIARHYVRPQLFGRLRFPMRRLWEQEVPQLLSSACIRLFELLPLPMITMAGGALAGAGHYGAAQNLAIVPRMVAGAFAPLLLATLTHAVTDGHEKHARDMGRDALRLPFLLLPFAAMCAGAGPEIVQLVFGSGFASASGPFAWLIFAKVATVMIANCSAILIAGGRPSWTLAAAVPMVVLAALGIWWAIPRFAIVGAAAVATLCAAFGALVSLAAANHVWRMQPPSASVLRSLTLSAAAYAVSTLWPTPGLLVLVKVAVISALILAGLIALREYTPRELALIRSLIPGKANVPVGGN